MNYFYLFYQLKAQLRRESFRQQYYPTLPNTDNERGKVILNWTKSYTNVTSPL